MRPALWVSPRCATALLGVATLARAHDVVPLPSGNGTIPATGGRGSAKWELFEDPQNVIAVTSVSQTPNGPGTPLAVQFNLARGFKGVGPAVAGGASNNGSASGLLLANFCGADLSPHAGAYGACPGLACPNGGIPCANTAGFCSGFDPVLSAALGGISGPNPYPNADAAVLEVSFIAALAGTASLTYTFGTYESPATPSFAETFGLWLDGTLVAGGDSNSGPVPGTDPWPLVPSEAAPPEFNAAPNAFWVIPAHTTGHRTLSLNLAPGPHTLRASVADSGPAITSGLPNGSPATPGACNIVGGFLVLGAKFVPGNACGLAIDYAGHPAAGASDFQTIVSGALPGSLAFLAVSSTSPPASGSAQVALVLPNPCGPAPLDLLVDPLAPFFSIFGPFPVGPSGGLSWPNPASPVPLGLAGSWLWIQAWTIDTTPAFRNSPGMRVAIGPA